MHHIDLTGQRFGRLVALSRIGTKNRKAVWLCQCDCGNRHEVQSDKLRSGRQVSCGCYRKENRIKHGESRAGIRTAEYTCWYAMIQRCTNPNNLAFHNYGSRGITVCDRWRNSYEAFLADMGRKPSPRHTLERRNNNRGYTPDNCCWATRAEQLSNRRTNVFLTYRGRTQTRTQWADELGIGRGTLRHRLRRGWSIERALTEPVNR